MSAIGCELDTRAASRWIFHGYRVPGSSQAAISIFAEVAGLGQHVEQAHDNGTRSQHDIGGGKAISEYPLSGVSVAPSTASYGALPGDVAAIELWAHLIAFASRKKNPRGISWRVCWQCPSFFIGRESCQAHPRTFCAPCVLYVLSHRTNRCAGTIRGWHKGSLQQ